jgi:hypothetical protein
MDSVLNSYSEIGYGIGNHIFNVAGFVSFKGKSISVLDFVCL